MMLVEEGKVGEPLSLRVARFRRELKGVLREIASSCPLVAESCQALLQLDPLDEESDAAIELHAAKIRRVLSDTVGAPNVPGARPPGVWQSDQCSQERAGLVAPATGEGMCGGGKANT